jgi:hypothetical protein
MSWTKIFDDPEARLTFSDCVDLECEMEKNMIVLSERDFEFLTDLLDKPAPEPNEALKKAARAYKENFSKS